MTDFLMRVAGLNVAVRSVYDRIAQQSADYLLPSAGFDKDAAKADIVVDVSQADIDHEREIGEPGDWSDPYLETLAVFRRIAEVAPGYRRLVFHGATLEYQGKAYIFTAPSGTGKTTHIRLWKQVFGDRVDIINGDKPMLKVDDSADDNGSRGEMGADLGLRGRATVTAYGTPWAGKERWQRNVNAPVAGICVVTRAREESRELDNESASTRTAFMDDDGVANTCERIDAAEAMPLILQQTYMPSDPSKAADTLDLLDTVLREVPVYRLSCTISEAAVKASAGAMVE
ncbi:hypothetical protein [Bifidobacterium simiarum]|uniref:Uncharacterized protein n=1 Tax=Bifidobacterium simiarum TaxID=2045441 RepID=A0A2M9HFY0_9BIFI|nr:hypothetical protein [Bifidobacterium simiarum]PJM75732.1 hypothetical protein CSQ87_02240 [Bifidobacterium simiarum]